MSSSVLGIGAALSALVWIGVLSFIVAAWVDDRRRELDEPEPGWSRQEARPTKAEPLPTGAPAGVDLADVDGIDLTAPARPIDLTPTAEAATPDIAPSDLSSPEQPAGPSDALQGEPQRQAEAQAEVDAPTWSARSESELWARPEHPKGGVSGSWLRYLGVVVLLAVARRVVSTRRLRL